MLARLAEKSWWSCDSEKTIAGDQGESSRPDLICTKNGQGAKVLDVTIVSERHSQCLELAYRAKMQIYKLLRRLLERQLQTTQLDIQGFPVGARGKWFPHNTLVLESQKVHNVRRAAIQISKMTLLMSLYMIGAFTREASDDAP